MKGKRKEESLCIRLNNQPELIKGPDRSRDPLKRREIEIYAGKTADKTWKVGLANDQQWLV